MYVLLGLVDLLTCSRALFCRQLAKRLKAGSNLTFLTEIGNSNRIQCSKVIGRIYFRRSLSYEIAQGGHCYEIKPADTASAGPLTLAGSLLVLLVEASLRGCGNGAEALRVMHSNIRENLAINLDLSLVQAIDQAAVR